jgi:ABC-type phosphate/phosphonate transport system ATPase subunit
MEEKILFIVRGLPGSGKSTLSKLLNATHFETDNYFMVDGEYKFDGSKLKEAHEWCQNQVSMAMIFNHTTGINKKIVVSNTFTQEWEMSPYFALAEQWGYQVTSLIVENRHGGVNTHGVPEDKLEIMKNRFEVKL